MRGKHREIFARDFSRERRARNDNFRGRARKNSLTLCNNFITHTPTHRVMTHIKHTQKIFATRICGLKGGIYNGD